MWRIIILCTIVNLVATKKSTYENYKVFKTVPLTETHYKTLRELENICDGYSFWKQPTHQKRTIKVMVAPHKISEFYEIMNKIDIYFELIIDNVQELINRTTQSISENNKHNSTFPFTKYPTYEKIYHYIFKLVENYTDKIEHIRVGDSYEKNSIFGVKVSFNNKSEKPGIFLQGGIHANEWISPVTVLYILHELITSTDPDVRSLAESHTWYIFPLLNPDGYKYTHTTNRMWKKSRKPSSIYCVGVDLNRNWDLTLSPEYLVSGDLDIRDPCSNRYAGTGALSEPETLAMAKYIKSISDKFYAYISFHSSLQALMFPYGLSSYPVDNYNELYNIGMHAAATLKRRYGTDYTVGSIMDVSYLTSGTLIDYIRNLYEKEFVYSYNLRDRDYYDFLLPPDQIVPTGQETLDSLVTMFKKIEASKHYGRALDIEE